MATENRHPDGDAGGLFSTPINLKISKKKLSGGSTTPNTTPIPQGKPEFLSSGSFNTSFPIHPQHVDPYPTFAFCVCFFCSDLDIMESLLLFLLLPIKISSVWLPLLSV